MNDVDLNGTTRYSEYQGKIELEKKRLMDKIWGYKEGECDKCNATYDVGSRENRCGNCGNCGSCCTHNGEGE